LKLSAPRYREPFLDGAGRVSPQWQKWMDEIVTALNAAPQVQKFAGDPNGFVSGYPGDLVVDVGGGALTTLYVKESGAGTLTGWVAK